LPTSVTLRCNIRFISSALKNYLHHGAAAVAAANSVVAERSTHACKWGPMQCVALVALPLPGSSPLLHESIAWFGLACENCFASREFTWLMTLLPEPPKKLERGSDHVLLAAITACTYYQSKLSSPQATHVHILRKIVPGHEGCLYDLG